MANEPTIIRPPRNKMLLESEAATIAAAVSAKEIIEQIKALPANEQAEVKRFAKELPDDGAESNVLNEQGGTMPSEMFDRAKAHVFAHYGPLLDKLAK